jgi:hypothetical protein
MALSLVPIEAGATNTNEKNKTIQNNCFYLQAEKYSYSYFYNFTSSFAKYDMCRTSVSVCWLLLCCQRLSVVSVGGRCPVGVRCPVFVGRLWPYHRGEDPLISWGIPNPHSFPPHGNFVGMYVGIGSIQYQRMVSCVTAEYTLCVGEVPPSYMLHTN